MAPKDLPLDIGAQRRLTTFNYADVTAIYFVTICTHNRAESFVDARLAQEVITSLDWLRTNRGVRLFAFCLMPDHLHLLLRLGDDGTDLSTLMGAFKSFTTRQSWKLGYDGPLWQKNFHDHILRKSEEAILTARYILQNPERKGLVEDASDYPYSGLPDPM